VGKDPALLQTRLALLTHEGYETVTALHHDAEYELRTGRFDLLVLGAALSEDEKDLLLQIAPKDLPVLQLQQLTLPADLLEHIGRRLGRAPSKGKE